VALLASLLPVFGNLHMLEVRATAAKQALLNVVVAVV
jgi:hypothetical protein